jgi:hypothetical protein
MACEPPFLVPLQEALPDLLAWWKAARVDALIIGGPARTAPHHPGIWTAWFGWMKHNGRDSWQRAGTLVWSRVCPTR